MTQKNFSPLLFLASLGAGGIAIMPFAFFQYTYHTGKGLITLNDIAHGTMSLGKEILFRSLEGIMILFTFIHIFLSIYLGIKLYKWLKTKSYKEMIQDPLRNAAILAPFISILMTMNVFIAAVRFFIPAFASNLQTFMFPALLSWIFLFVLLIRMEIKLLKISFINGFDVDKITFGWLLHPFALSMLTVVGTGIAAMANNPSIAHTAAFMSLISFTMGLFLFIVKIISIFKSHFNQKGLPERQFLPSFLIVVPVVTLFSISAFRLGHYLEHQFGYSLGPFFMIVTLLAFTFEIWYLAFGLSLLKEYFTKFYFKNEYYVTQWGLICPIVAFGVLGSFVYSTFIVNSILYYGILIIIIFAIIFYLDLFIRLNKCIFKNDKSNIDCI
jgi:hypothetical protein